MNIGGSSTTDLESQARPQRLTRAIAAKMDVSSR